MQREYTRAFNKYIDKTIHKPYKNETKTISFVMLNHFVHIIMEYLSRLKQNNVSYTDN